MDCRLSQKWLINLLQYAFGCCCRSRLPPVGLLNGSELVSVFAWQTANTIDVPDVLNLR